MSTTLPSPAAIEPVRKSITVRATPERAFRVFTEEMDSWWPRTHHIGSSPMKRVVVSPEPGVARLLRRTPRPARARDSPHPQQRAGRRPVRLPHAVDPLLLHAAGRVLDDHAGALRIVRVGSPSGRTAIDPLNPLHCILCRISP